MSFLVSPIRLVVVIPLVDLAHSSKCGRWSMTEQKAEPLLQVHETVVPEEMRVPQEPNCVVTS